MFYYDLESVDVYQACVLGLTDFLTVIVPYYCVVDAEFIKIFWCKHLKQPGDQAQGNGAANDI